MSFLFVSHASEDKVARIRPLVEVLVDEGESVWIDRPGAGEENFGFSQSYIDRHDIDYLQSGQPWSTGIQSALQASGAVIGCLSRALLKNKAVLKDELTYADTSRKLVTCIVDDLSFEDLSKFEDGLLDLRNFQSPKIDCDALREALELRRRNGAVVEELPEGARTEWEKVRNLISQVNRLRPEPRPLRKRDVVLGSALLYRIPVGPILRVHHIPQEIFDAFGQTLATAERVDSAFNQAMALLTESFPEGYTERQILVRRGQLPPFGTLPPEVFWLEVLSLAGLKARRTFASFLITPVARWALEQAGATDVAENFLGILQIPNSLSP